MFITGEPVKLLTPVFVSTIVCTIVGTDFFTKLKVNTTI